MDIISKMREKIKLVLEDLGYVDKVPLIHASSRPEFGEFQYNGAMQIAKEIKKNPREVAENIIKKLNEFDIFENLNIAGPGFINISIKDVQI